MFARRRIVLRSSHALEFRLMRFFSLLFCFRIIASSTVRWRRRATTSPLFRNSPWSSTQRQQALSNEPTTETCCPRAVVLLTKFVPMVRMQSPGVHRLGRFGAFCACYLSNNRKLPRTAKRSRRRSSDAFHSGHFFRCLERSESTYFDVIFYVRKTQKRRSVRATEGSECETEKKGKH